MSDWSIRDGAVSPKLHENGDDDEAEYSDLYSAWIERTFKMHKPPANKSKPSPSDCKTVAATCYGRVVFDTNAVSNEQAIKSSKPFIRLSSNTKAEDVTNLLNEHWNLRLPRMIISVTGGATTFELPPRLDKMIREGLCRAAMSSNAWIVTGGTNTGVMKYVGSAIKEVQTQVTSPLIGIATWSVANNKERLCFDSDGDETKGGVVAYGNPDDFDKPYLSLDRNHTHFILVDDGTVGQFGGEIELRAKVEANVGSRASGGQFGVEFPVSNVVIAIQGGPGTLQTCLEAVRGGIPIVVVNGSGKAADAIAYAFKLRHDTHSHQYSEVTLRKLIREELSRKQTDEEVKTLLDKVYECVQVKEQVFVYEVDFYGRHDVGLDVAILDAILSWERTRVEKGQFEWLEALDVADENERRRAVAMRAELRKARLLELALTWNRIDVAKEETARYRIIKDFDSKIDQDPITQAKARMFKWALVHDKKEFVKLFLETMDTKDVSAFLSTPTTTDLTIPSLRSIALGRMARKQASRQKQKIKWGNLKHRFRVPMPPQLNTDPLPAHCKSLMHDIASAKLFTDLKTHFHSRLGITEGLRGYDLNIDVDFDGIPDIRKQEDLQELAKKQFQMESGANAWQMLSYFDVFFVRYLYGQGYMVSKIPNGERGPTACHQDVVDGLTRAVHLLWVHRKLDDGWAWAEELNMEEKESPLICAFDENDTDNDGGACLPTSIRNYMRDQAMMFLTTLYDAMRIVVWRPNTFEDLFLRLSMGRTQRERIKYIHLSEIFPGGSFWESRIRLVLHRAVHPRANYLSLFRLDPFFLLTLWAGVAGFNELTKYFWRSRPDAALQNALVLTLLLKSILTHDDKLPPEVVVQFEELTGEIMDECVDVVKHIDASSSTVAERLFKVVSVNAGGIPTPELAYQVGHEALISTNPFFRVLDELWYDNIDVTNGLLKLLFAAVMPLYLLIPGDALTEAQLHSYSSMSFLAQLKLALPVRIDSSVAIDANQDGVVDETDDVYEEIIQDSTIANVDMMEMDEEHSVRQLKRMPTFHIIVNRDSFLNNAGRRMFRFYMSPAISFVLDTLSFVLLLLLFSYNAVQPTTSYRAEMFQDESWVAVATFAWMVTMMVEEMRQVLQLGFQGWWGQMWNRWDFVMYTLYIASIVLRFSGVDSDLGRSRIVTSIVAVMLWSRLARYYAVNRELGPKLIMIQLMVKDIIVFLGLMVLVYAGYAVALFSILHENTKWQTHTFTEMVFMPYFQIYGELFLEEMREDTKCVNPEFTDCNGDPGWFAVPLLAGYILVANILLVNLLIAMMSSTFEAVESRALELWAYQNLDVLIESRDSWILPAPFNVVRNLYLGVRWIFRKLSDLKPTGVVAPIEGPSEDDLKEFQFFKAAESEVHDLAKEYIEEFWADKAKIGPHERVLEAVSKVEAEMQLMHTLVLRSNA